MGIINFGSRIKNRKFDYIPRYYNPEKEEQEQRMKMYKEDYTLSDTQLSQSRIKASFRQKYRAQEDAYSSKSKKRSNRILLMTLGLMLVISYFFLVNYLPRILAMLE